MSEEEVNENQENKEEKANEENTTEKSDEKLPTIEESIVAKETALPTIKDMISNQENNDKDNKKEIKEENKKNRRNKRKNKKNKEEKEIKESKEAEKGNEEENKEDNNEENEVEEEKEVGDKEKEEKEEIKKDDEEKESKETKNENNIGEENNIENKNENEDITTNNTSDSKKNSKEEEPANNNNNINNIEINPKKNIVQNSNSDNDSVAEFISNREDKQKSISISNTETDPLNPYSKTSSTFKIIEITSEDNQFSRDKNNTSLSPNSYKFPYSFNISSVNEPVHFTVFRELFLIFKKLKFVFLSPFICNKNKNNKKISYNDIDNNDNIDYHIRQWDLIIPFILDFILAITLRTEEKNQTGRTVWFFIAFWIGCGLTYFMNLFLEIQMGFFQICSILGYCLLPLNICGIILKIIKFWKLIRFFFCIGSLIWCGFGINAYLGILLPEDKIKKKYLIMYPIMLLYFYFGIYLFINWK